MLAVLTTHPIQYQIPLWREMAARGVSLQVWYLSDQGFRKSHDKGFGAEFAWDIDMMSGYSSCVLPTRPRKIDISKFWGARIKDCKELLRSRKVSAILINGWVPYAYWQGTFCAHSLGIPVLLRAETNDLRQVSWMDPLKRPIMRQLFKRIEKFLAIGIANRRYYESYGIPTSRIGRSPYCVDNRYFYREAESLRTRRALLRESFGIPADAMCFLYCGKLISKKRVGDLISAVDLLTSNPDRYGLSSRLHLLIVGDGELKAEFQAKVSSAKQSLKESVTFAGFLNQSEIPKAYVVSDCIVLPSDEGETWGLVVNEAMACGLPAIVSNKVGCGEDLITEELTGTRYPVGDVQQLAEALALWSYPVRCHGAKDSVLRKISEYSIEKASQGILEWLPLSATDKLITSQHA